MALSGWKCIQNGDRVLGLENLVRRDFTLEDLRENVGRVVGHWIEVQKESSAARLLVGRRSPVDAMVDRVVGCQVRHVASKKVKSCNPRGAPCTHGMPRDDG